MIHIELKEEKYIEFFNTLIKVFPQAKQVELLDELVKLGAVQEAKVARLSKQSNVENEAFMEDDCFEEDMYIEEGIHSVLTHDDNRVIFSVYEMDADGFNGQTEALSQAYGLAEAYNWDGQGSLYAAIQKYVDWLDIRGYNFTYWIEGIYNFRGLLSKKSDTHELLAVGERAGFRFQPVLPTVDQPSWFKVVERVGERMDLLSLLEDELQTAKSMGRHLVLYLGMNECRPCTVVEGNLHHHLLQDALEDVYLVRVNLLDSLVSLKALYLQITSAPTFIYINENAEATAHQINGGAWDDDDTLEEIVKSLKVFCREIEDKPLALNDESKYDAITLMAGYGSSSAFIKMLERIDYPMDDGKETSLLHHVAGGTFVKNETEKSIDYLLAQGLDINCYDEFGNTPLITAINASAYGAAKTLLDRGAGATKINSKGEAPLVKLIMQYCDFDDVEVKPDAYIEEQISNLLISREAGTSDMEYLLGSVKEDPYLEGLLDALLVQEINNRK